MRLLLDQPLDPVCRLPLVVRRRQQLRTGDENAHAGADEPHTGRTHRRLTRQQLQQRSHLLLLVQSEGLGGVSETTF